MHVDFLPDIILGNIFSYLSLQDLRSSSLVCKRWYSILNDEDNDVWRLHCIHKLAEEVLSSDLLSSTPTYKTKLKAFHHAWNPEDCSRNIYIKPNGFTIHRNPVAQSTDAVRGKIGFSHGRHAWEVVWEGPLGTVAVVGIATKEATLQTHGYIALLGSDDQSWGWNLVDNHLLHNGDSQGNYPMLNNAPKYQWRRFLRLENGYESFSIVMTTHSRSRGIMSFSEWHLGDCQKSSYILQCLPFMGTRKSRWST
ncbi:F-box/SPRY domain-containing protein 1 [Daphnia magna]|uniref:F-box/SPRY domain-containing protein 1 n=1 Tax=Daphnia magna TaxID=35525 RepID=A0A164X5T0_9CRUS|nr:F-box/SPRY domain-containing protein 1 [Daphnia magna]